MKLLKYIGIAYLIIFIPTISSAIDDYYCFNNPGTPECNVPVELLTDPTYTSSSSQAKFNASYVSAIVTSGGSFIPGSSSGTKSSTSTGSIALNTIISDDNMINVYPFSLFITKNLLFEITVSSIRSKEHDMSYGDSSYGLKYNFQNILAIDSLTVGANFTIPTGDRDKGYSSLTNRVSLSLALKKYIQEDKLYFSVNTMFVTEINEPIYGLCTTEYIEYGDSAMVTAILGQSLLNNLSLNIKYILNSISSTTISDVKQDDAVIYQDIAFSVDSSIFNIPLSFGYLIPHREFYADGIADQPRRSDSFFFSISNPF
ncbi:hypothetical protein GJV85_13490 (plasmid) [Sulfurimonas aquatica]|uniref:Uncharacterized protein n=1 Tax=Sulfurimonas aquatica TaxID=2672570 RepID=A0A975B2X0_9BACT|nr:hypothetical protein [Sulfurimonas aquatica]QSZ43183.1 hypothetical protein GJV85_13490 [Sulfurimonas aquatica]